MSKPLFPEGTTIATIITQFPEIEKGGTWGTWYCPEEIHGIKEYCELSCGDCWAKALETMEVVDNE